MLQIFSLFFKGLRIAAFSNVSPRITHIKHKQSFRVQEEGSHFHYCGGDVFIILCGCYVCCLRYQASKSGSSVCQCLHLKTVTRLRGRGGCVFSQPLSPLYVACLFLLDNRLILSHSVGWSKACFTSLFVP